MMTNLLLSLLVGLPLGVLSIWLVHLWDRLTDSEYAPLTMQEVRDAWTFTKDMLADYGE